MWFVTTESSQVVYVEKPPTNTSCPEGVGTLFIYHFSRVSPNKQNSSESPFYNFASSCVVMTEAEKLALYVVWIVPSRNNKCAGTYWQPEMVQDVLLRIPTVVSTRVYIAVLFKVISYLENHSSERVKPEKRVFLIEIMLLLHPSPPTGSSVPMIAR